MILVLKAEGSTPLKTGARAVAEASGRIFGSIGGGAVEAEAQAQAVRACRSGRPLVFDFHLDGADRDDDTPICGGSMRILVDPRADERGTVYSQVVEALDRGERGVLVTTVENGALVRVELAWHPGTSPATCLGSADADREHGCQATEMPQLFVEQGTETLVEPIVPQPRLLIAGGGHVGQALARQAVLVDFAVTVIDDRPEFTAPERFPAGVRTECGGIAQRLAGSSITQDTYVVIATRGHQFDAEALEACIRRPAAYVGMIGSERKVALTRRSLLEAGLATEEELDRVYAPIGLAIGSVTASEIAASIVAQLIAVRRQGSSK